MKIFTAMLGVLALSLVAYPDQDCGSSQLGGIIGPGAYVGLGASCKEAKADLKADLGMQAPNCDNCPPGELGCIPGSNIPDDSCYDQGNCHWDPVLEKWVVAASVSCPTNWEETCSSCN